jgi:hypothetical protein
MNKYFIGVSQNIINLNIKTNQQYPRFVTIASNKARSRKHRINAMAKSKKRYIPRGKVYQKMYKLDSACDYRFDYKFKFPITRKIRDERRKRLPLTVKNWDSLQLATQIKMINSQ